MSTQRRVSLSVVSCLLFILPGLNPDDAAGQAAPAAYAESNCGWEMTCGGHWANHAVGATSEGPVREGLHGECRVCRNYADPDRPYLEWWYCHDPCDLEGIALEDYRRALDAAETRDVTRLLEIQRKLPSMIAINHKRQSIQIKACDEKTIIANIPLGAAYAGVMDNQLRQLASIVSSADR